MSMRKLIATTVAVVSVALATNADTVTTNGVTWTYTVNNATAKTVTLGTGSGNGNAIGGTSVAVAAADIPWKFIGEADGEIYTVTKIANYAFKNCTQLTGNLEIPSSVTEVGVHAFHTCTGLTGIKLGPNITTMGSWAFLYCSNAVCDLSDLTSVTSFPMASSTYGPLEAGNKSHAGAWKTKFFGHVRFHPNLTGISSCMFRGVPITGVTLPDSLTSIKDTAFNNTLIKAMWLKGSVNIDLKWCLGSTPLEIFFAGPDTTCSNPNPSSAADRFTTDTAATFKVFIPAKGNWLNLDTSNAPGVEKIYYGPGRGVDISVNTARNELTATPTNATRLVTMMESAPLFREHFGLDTRISVTNAIDLTGVTITEQMVSGVTFDRLMFKVNNQAQLNAILNAFPASAPLSIDPTDITENLTVPAARKIHVMLSEADAVRLKVKGLVIIVK